MPVREEQMSGRAAPGRGLPRVLLAAALCATTLAVESKAAAAFEIFGIKLWGSSKNEDADIVDPLRYSTSITSSDADKDLIKNVLQGGVHDPNSVANTMTNKAYAALASAFNFEAYGESATTTNPAQQPTVDKYMRQTLEEDAGQSNEGVRLALYFQRKASTITSWYQVLADTALASVVRTALGLPDSFASADIDKQVQLFEQKLNIADFSDPKKLDKFITRFTSLWEINNPTSAPQTAASVLFAQPVTVGISTDLMMAMQKLKF